MLIPKGANLIKLQYNLKTIEISTINLSPLYEF